MKVLFTLLLLTSVTIMLIASRRTHEQLFESWLAEIERELNHELTVREYVFLSDLFNANHLITPQQAIEELKAYRANMEECNKV
jgi:hypothetical protein